MEDHRRLPPGHRGIRLGDTPRTSVVVASTGDTARLGAFLSWMLPLCQARNIEVVVARSCPIDEYRELEATWPSVLFMPAQDNATVRQLRVAGLSAADGDIVTLVEDGMDQDALWLEDLPSSAPLPPAPESP